MKTKFPFIIVLPIIQTIILFFLRKLYLMTVYQTVITYLFISILGFFVIYIAEKKKDNIIWSNLKHLYLLVWSSFHGIIVLGFLTCGTFYLTLTQLNIVQIINIFLGFSIYWIFYLISGRYGTAITIGNVFIGIVGVLNHYLMRFRGAAFQISDIKAAQTAGNVAINYNYLPSIIMIVAILDLVIWTIWVRYLLGEEDKKKNRFTMPNIIVTVVVVGCCMALPLMNFEDVYKRTGQFSKDTYLSALLADVLGNAVTLPKDYSLQAVEEIISTFERTDVDNTDKEEPVAMNPNIVVIMNEAFSDLRILGEFETNIPVLSYWDSINDNALKGWANVSVVGGTTANSEYEFLSSDSTGMYTGVNGIPYSNYFNNNEDYPSIVSVLNEQGYETTAFHPYLSSGWNRLQVYRSMGFEHLIFREDIEEELDTLRLYTSDLGDYSYIKKLFNEKENLKSQFIFNITMQNHGGYTYNDSDFAGQVHLVGEQQGQFPQAEQFLSLMKYSDEAFADLLNFFDEYAEPVIVLLFGDHQPTLENGFYEYVTGKTINDWSLEERMNQYKTPFVIWHNYATESQQIGDVSLNYLAAILLDRAGLNMSPYQQYTLQQFQELPVVTSLGLKDRNDQLYSNGSEQFNLLSWQYRLLNYNHTVDIEGRVDWFFELQ